MRYLRSINAARPVQQVIHHRSSCQTPLCVLNFRRVGPAPNEQQCRSFHVPRVLTGFLEDLKTGLRDDDGASAIAAAEQKAEAERNAFSNELDHANWIDPDFREILKEGHPDCVLHALQHPVWGPTFMRWASPFLFHGALKLIPPAHFLGPYLARSTFLFSQPRKKTVPRGMRGVSLRPQVSENIKGYFCVYSNLQLRFDLFSECIEQIIKARTEAGHPITLDTYKYLLDLARTMGDGDMADDMFADLTAQNEPDAQCYDLYMESKVWAGQHGFYEHDRRFVTSRMRGIRSLEMRPVGFTAHRTGSEGGLRLAMLAVLDHMVMKQHAGTEATYSHLITAMGREGDLEGVKKVLRAIWNFDVDAIEAIDEDEWEETPVYYDRASPLRPTERLLYAIAHVYSINRKPLEGLVIVDYVSRQYDIRIPRAVWSELLAATYIRVIKRRRERISRDPEQLSDLLPFEAFEKVWNLMTDEPHKLVPDVAMQIFRVRCHIGKRHRTRAFHSLKAAIDMLNEECIKAYHILKRFLDSCEELSQFEHLHDEAFILPASWFQLRDELVRSQIELEAVFRGITFCSKRVLKERNFPGSRTNWTWEHVLLPDGMRVFRAFLPNELSFNFARCRVTVHGLGPSREFANNERVGRIYSYLGLLRIGFDGLPHKDLVQNLEIVAENRKAFEPICAWCGDSDRPHPILLCSRKNEKRVPWEKVANQERESLQQLKAIHSAFVAPERANHFVTNAHTAEDQI